MANTIDWGKATQNNTNGFGKYQNTIGAASIYADSYSGETALVGTSAAFSYSKSSYHQDETDPTPTITGTTGGTFSATPSGLSINASTGTIDLSASTIQPYTITYTVSGVSANFSLSVTASPFIANNFSMDFDSASSQYIDAGIIQEIRNVTSASFSCWFYREAANPGQLYGVSIDSSNRVGLQIVSNALRFWVNNIKAEINNFITSNGWYHILITYDGTQVTASERVKVYKNGENTPLTNSPSIPATFGDLNSNFKIGLFTTAYLQGKLDEVAIWNTALSSDAVTEIYNATANNTGKALDLSTDYNNYTSSSNLQYWNRLGD